jgi:hypothetical protein
MAWKYKATITVPEETRGYGESRRVLPAQVATVELTLELDRIVNHFGAKAARSKGQRTTALGGRVKIKVLKSKAAALA